MQNIGILRNLVTFKRNSLYNLEGTGTTWGRGSRGRGRGRGGGASLLGSGVAPANYSPGLQGVAPELREVVNILGERNQVGTLTGVGPPPGTLDNDGQGDEEEGAPTKRPPRPLYRRLINYVRQAWTGVKFALGIWLAYRWKYSYVMYLCMIKILWKYSFMYMCMYTVCPVYLESFKCLGKHEWWKKKWW